MALKPISLEMEFQKNPELDETALDSLRSWVDKQPHLPKVADLDLILFLHSCYWSVERAKHTIDSYYTIRTLVPEFFSQRDPMHPSIVNAMDVVNIFLLPKQLDTGERIFYAMLRDTDSSKYNFANALKYLFSVQDLILQEYGTSSGFMLVMDLKGVAMGHMARLGLLTMKKFLTYLQEAMPVRFRGLHFINPVPFMDKLLGLMKPLMKPELVALLHVHMQMDSFYQHVEKHLLPEDVGGEQPSTTQLGDDMAQKMRANTKFFLDEELLRVNESLRPGKAKDIGHFFGVDGSFKKLEFD